jgi:LacI family transcriptional regulator
MAEVAVLAGVSKITVSRALSGSAPVAQATRDRIDAAIAQLGYEGNEYASALARGRSATVSVVVPFVGNPSAAQRVRGMVSALRATDQPVTLFDVEQPSDRDAHIRAIFTRRRPSGAIVVSLLPTRHERELYVRSGVPVVLIEATADRVPSVSVDDVEAGRLATRHLIELGHRRIAFVGDDEANPFGFMGSARRRQGYEDQMERSGLPAPTEFVQTGPPGRAEATEAAERLFASVDPPTAVVTSSDLKALGVIDAVRSRGLRVPEDVSVVGIDDLEWSRDLGLTTVDVRLHDSGVLAGEMLAGLMASPEAPGHAHMLDVRLQVRGTTGPRVGD